MMIFHVSGMSCRHCVNAITRAVRAQDAAATVEVDLAAGTVSVDSRVLDAAAIRALIAAEGYTVAD